MNVFVPLEKCAILSQHAKTYLAVSTFASLFPPPNRPPPLETPNTVEEGTCEAFSKPKIAAVWMTASDKTAN